MSTRASAALLIQALKELNLDWDRTKAYWNDAKAQQFELNYLEPLPDHISRAFGVIQDIEAILKKIRNDCE